MTVTARGLARGTCLALSALFVVLAAASTSDASNRYDPRLRFRTISTPHFDIYYHQTEESEARRLAVIAEEVWSQLQPTLGRTPDRVRVILVDQNDLANGWATPFPYNLIEITAAAPGGESIIGNTDNWLRLVFSHEYTHILHLSRSEGWIGGLRRIFGRHPILFPNAFLPIWQIEGIAVFEESALTGQGRIPAEDFGKIARLAAAAGRWEPLDRVNGGLVDWPSGTAPYVYGAYFHQFLADRYGQESLRRLADETSHRIPYFGSLAFRKVYGRSLGSLWKEFESTMRDNATPPSTIATRLTHHGFQVIGPRFGSDGRVYYSVANPHDFPSLLSIAPDGVEPPRHITRRVLGNRLGFSGAAIVFDQLEIVHDVALQSDLYAIEPTEGRPWRLTRGSRAADPDVSPDGRTIVCTVQRNDRRELATMTMPAVRGHVEAPTTYMSEAGTEFSSPRWSPDGHSIAVERRTLNGPSEIVVFDAATKQPRVVATSSRGRNISPSWMDDGRRLLFASDREGGPFRIFSVDVGTGETSRLDDTGVSAESPELSRDGGTLVYVGYTNDGYDLFSMPMSGAKWVAIGPSNDRTQAPTLAPAQPVTDPTQGSTHQAASLPDRSYSPWSTLAPRFWTPIVESDAGETLFGAATAGVDALGRHSYYADVAWTRARADPDWNVAYAYDRWWPTLFADTSNDTDPFRTGQIRSREVNAGALFPVRRARWAQAVLAAVHTSSDTIECPSCPRPIDSRADRQAFRAAWQMSAAHSYGYSISAEQGWSSVVSTEFARGTADTPGTAGSATADVRVYVRAVPRHGVVAARVAGATAWGDESIRRVFGASGPGPQPGGFRFGSDAIGLLRGFDEGDVLGRHAMVVNVDYRVPLRRIDRGIGTIPFFARVVHGAAFVDAGQAWDDPSSRQGMRVSTGVELSLDAVLGYTVPLTFTTGAAWRHDGTAGNRGVVIFGRIGHAF